MNKITKAATVAIGCLVAALAPVSQAQAFSGKRHADKSHHSHHHYREHRIRAKYAPRLRQGHRPDCAQLKKRAVLTGNAYWRYAAHSCTRDHYRKAY